MRLKIEGILTLPCFYPKRSYLYWVTKTVIDAAGRPYHRGVMGKKIGDKDL